jgi:5'-3' exonuclease
MGIERFFNKLREQFDIINTTEYPYTKLLSDHIFFDFNSIIHTSSQRLMNDLNMLLKYILILKNTGNKDNNINSIIKKYNITDLNIDKLISLDESDIITSFNEMFDTLTINQYVVKLVKNNVLFILENNFETTKIKTIYIGIDGVPSKSKMLEQKRRRVMGEFLELMKLQIADKHKNLLDNNDKGYNRYLFEKNKTKWSKNFISPCTNLMNLMQNQLKSEDYIKKLINITQNNDLKYIVSGYVDNGEAEKKIINYINNNEMTGNLTIYSPDADVILLSLLIKDNNFKNTYILRHDQQLSETTKTHHEVYNIIYIDLLKSTLFEYITENLKRKININIQKVIEDIVFVFTLFGDDFLPKILSYDVNNDIELLLKTYSKYLSMVTSENDMYLLKTVDSIYQINGKAFKIFIHLLAIDEDDIIHRNYLQKNNSNYENMIRNVNDYIKHNKSEFNIIDSNNINEFISRYNFNRDWDEFNKSIENLKQKFIMAYLISIDGSFGIHNKDEISINDSPSEDETETSNYMYQNTEGELLGGGKKKLTTTMLVGTRVSVSYFIKFFNRAYDTEFYKDRKDVLANKILSDPKYNQDIYRSLISNIKIDNNLQFKQFIKNLKDKEYGVDRHMLYNTLYETSNLQLIEYSKIKKHFMKLFIKNDELVNTDFSYLEKYKEDYIDYVSDEFIIWDLLIYGYINTDSKLPSLLKKDLYKQSQKLQSIYTSKTGIKYIGFKQFSTSINDSFHKSKIEGFDEYEKEIYKFTYMLDEFRYKLNVYPFNLITDESKDIEYNKKIYYDSNFNSNKVDVIVSDYIEGMIWLIDYYYNDVMDTNKWYFKYECSPLIKEIDSVIDDKDIMYLKIRKDLLEKNTVKNNEWFSPLEQLLYITNIDVKTLKDTGFDRSLLLFEDYISDTSIVLIKNFILSLSDNSVLKNFYFDLNDIVKQVYVSDSNDKISCKNVRFLNKCLITKLGTLEHIDKEFYDEFRKTIDSKTQSQIIQLQQGGTINELTNLESYVDKYKKYKHIYVQHKDINFKRKYKKYKHLLIDMLYD